MKCKRKIAMVLAMVMAICMLPVYSMQVKAADKQPVLSQTKVTLFVTPDDNKLKQWDYRYGTEFLNVANATGPQTWKSSNKKVATVSKHGTVTAKKKGTATITCKMGSKTLKCKVTVKNLPAMNSKEEKAMDKKVSITCSKVNDKFMKVTFKNKLSYPVDVKGTCKQYDSNGQLLKNKKQRLREISNVVMGNSSAVRYIALEDGYAYHEISDIGVGKLRWMLGSESYAYIPNSKLEMTPLEVYNLGSFYGPVLDYKINNKTEFPIGFDYQVLVYDKVGKLVSVQGGSNQSEGKLMMVSSKTGNLYHSINGSDLEENHLDYVGNTQAEADYLKDNFTYKINVCSVYIIQTCND